MRAREGGNLGVCPKTMNKRPKDMSVKAKKPKTEADAEIKEHECEGLSHGIIRELLRQHCKGMWSDSEDDSNSNGKTLTKQQKVVKCNDATFEPPHAQEGHASPEGAKRKINKDLTTDMVERETTETKIETMQQASRSHTAAIGGPPPLQHNPRQRQKQGIDKEDAAGLQGFGGVKRALHQPLAVDASHTCKGKALGKWNCMRRRVHAAVKAAPAATTSAAAVGVEVEKKGQQTAEGTGSVSRSLQLLKAMSGLPSPSTGSREGLKEVSGKPTGGNSNPNKQQEPAATREARKEFNEAVQDIRKMVYPHLGRFQRRQFLTTALRAMGIDIARDMADSAAGKTQKMPLPELRARQKAKAEAISKRRAEEKTLGVTSHIDYQGSIQEATRSRLKLKAQKARRKHLRDTFKHAGKLSSRQKNRKDVAS